MSLGPTAATLEAIIIELLSALTDVFNPSVPPVTVRGDKILAFALLGDLDGELPLNPLRLGEL